MPSQLPIKEGLFTWPAECPQLLGSRCRDCGELAFPAQQDCRSCCSRDTERVALGDRGVLWTWTIQSFMPKPPYHSDENAETFVPYGVGYVEMPSGIRVEARLRENTPEALHIGMPMRLRIDPYRTEENGDQIMMFSFEKAEEN